MRFLNYTDNWSIKSLDRLLYTVPTNSLSWDNLSYDEVSSLKNIHYGLIHKGFENTLVDGNEKIIPFIKNTNLPKKYTNVEKGDLILADASEDKYDVGKPIEFTENHMDIVSGLHTIHCKDLTHEFELGYKGFYLNSNKSKKQIQRIANGTKIYSISSSNFKEIMISYPCKEEQRKIVNLLAKIEERITTQIKIIKALELQKKIIAEEIFKSLSRKPNGTIRNFVDYDQPTKYIVKNTDYVNKTVNSIPVLTANQSFILGYTNENEGVFNCGECILFDDFTMDLKYVNFPFKIKSSAIKILTPKNNVNIRYVYEYLKHLNLSSSEHRRHYISEVEVLDVFIPAIEIQNSKMKIINAFDEKLKNEKAILISYIKEKNYLLNNLFI